MGNVSAPQKSHPQHGHGRGLCDVCYQFFPGRTRAQSACLPLDVGPESDSATRCAGRGDFAASPGRSGRTCVSGEAPRPPLSSQSDPTGVASSARRLHADRGLPSAPRPACPTRPGSAESWHSRGSFPAGPAGQKPARSVQSRAGPPGCDPSQMQSISEVTCRIEPERIAAGATPAEQRSATVGPWGWKGGLPSIPELGERLRQEA